jgi:membrane protein YqaA with SNARE-associated domain
VIYDYKYRYDIIGVVTSATCGSVAGAVVLYGIGRMINVNKLEKNN